MVFVGIHVGWFDVLHVGGEGRLQIRPFCGQHCVKHVNNVIQFAWDVVARYPKYVVFSVDTHNFQAHYLAIAISHMSRHCKKGK